ncbi:MAG: hypothetical protein ABI461_13175 [Polyangiaceae bacterium]
MKNMYLLRIIVAIAAIGLFSAGCDDKETTAVIANAYPTTGDGGFDSAKSVGVYKGWWLVTVFTDPVAAGAQSDPHRVVSGNDAAYVILAPGWDPASGTTPSVLIPAKSNGAIGVAKGDQLTITIDDAHFTGNCATGHPLAQIDADFITENIFPGDFAGMTYDAATCTLTPIPEDAGDDSGTFSDAGTSDDAD